MLAKFCARIHGSYVPIGVALGVILTIAVAQIWGITLPTELVSWPWLAVALIFILAALLRPMPITLLLAVIAGGLIANYRVSFDLQDQRYLENLTGQTITVSGVIAEDPEAVDLGYALRLTNLQIHTTLNAQDEDVASDAEVAVIAVSGVLYVQVEDDLFGEVTPQRSDTITLQGKMSAGFGTFAGSLYRPDVLGLTRAEPGDWLLNLRATFSGAVRTAIESPAADLGLGYLLGVKSALPEDLQMTLQTVGLTHIVVASGANLSILVDFARRRFGKISRFAAFVLASALVVMFVFMVGFSATMVRAGMVSLLSLVAWYFGRSFLPGRLLMIVAALTLLYSPVYLLDVGWQLSFAAFAGILIVGPRLTNFLYGGKPERKLDFSNQHLQKPVTKGPNFVAAILIETTAATLLCLPILIYTFGQFSLISLLANLLVLPTIPYAMATTFVTGLLALAQVPVVTELFATVASAILNFNIATINFFGEQTAFLVTIDPDNPLVFWLYLPVVVVLGWAELRKWRWRRQVHRLTREEKLMV